MIKFLFDYDRKSILKYNKYGIYNLVLLSYNTLQYFTIFYILEDLKCLFYSTKNIQYLFITECVNYDFVKTTTLTAFIL